MSATTDARIAEVRAFEMLDSRGNPTLGVEVALAGGAEGHAKVPSGASTGAHEAIELRDGDERFGGRGVLQAVANVRGVLGRAVRGLDATDLDAVDRALREADGTENLARLGANAVLGVSLASARAAAVASGAPLHVFLADAFGAEEPRLPVPMFNVLNGGAHADNGLAVQEIMVVPAGLPRFGDALRAGAEIYQALKSSLSKQGLSTSVGDEGGFAPRVTSNGHAIELVADAIRIAGYEPGQDVWLALDVAATEFHGPDGYAFEGRTLQASDLLDLYQSWIADHPIYSIEDGLAEDDWDGWAEMTARLGDDVQLVGDDLFVTNVARLERGIRERAANAVLVKPNQVGTLTDTFACVRTAYEGGFTAVMSHRSGETEDTTIADLAVALGTGQIKTGAPCRGERTAKYNRLLRIEASLEEASQGPAPFGLPAGCRGVVRA